MTGFYIANGCIYYEGEQRHEDDVALPQRPSNSHDWIDGAWVECPLCPFYQIEQLEAQQTPRRLREAALGLQESIDFLQDIEDQIAVLRGHLDR